MFNIPRKIFWPISFVGSGFYFLLILKPVKNLSLTIVEYQRISSLHGNAVSANVTVVVDLHAVVLDCITVILRAVRIINCTFLDFKTRILIPCPRPNAQQIWHDRSW